jgi:carbon starvation protein
MALPLLALATMAMLAIGYFAYGRFVARQYLLDEGAVTPAVARADGVDFVPTRPFYLLGQHFSAIAAAGPIVGPILACRQFGWLPCILWIGFGVVFIGAVHDLSALVASVRHGANSIAEIAKRNLSKRAWASLLAFLWLSLLYVIVAFTDVTASTFVGTIEELGDRKVAFDKGGAVALASALYLALAVVMGVVQRRLSPPLWLTTAIFVPATLGAVWLGMEHSTLLSLGGGDARVTWGLILLGYCFVASLLPVSVLLQPRGYLGGFVLYLVLAVGVIGVFFGGFAVEQPAFKGFTHVAGDGSTVSLFPFLFVTIACGACSGFHGLVCGGTTSKQIARETHCRPVGYGAMLLEAFVALIALATIMIVATPGAKGAGAVYSEGIGKFVALLVGQEHVLFATVFGAMAFSTFIFDTLDVATRLGRYVLQELFSAPSRAAAAVATFATVGVPAVFLLSAPASVPGKPPAYMGYWTLFGTSNQLLAGLTLLSISVWLHRLGRRFWFTLAPAVFVLSITLWSLGLQIASGISAWGASGFGTLTVNALVAVVLVALAVVFAGEAWSAARRTSPAPATPPAPGA